MNPEDGINTRVISLISDQRLFAIGTVLVIISLMTQGAIRYNIFGISTTSWDYVGLSLLPFLIKVLVSNKRIVDQIPKSTKILVASYLAAILISILRSPDIGDAYTIGLMVMRNIVMAFWVYYAVQICGPKQISKLIVFTVAIGSFIAIVLFATMILFDSAVLDQRRPYGYIILLIDEYKIPRLTGFAGDPNFFGASILMTIGLSFYLYVTSRGLLRKLAMVAFLVSVSGLVLTLSRTGLASLIIVVLLSILVLIVKSHKLRNCWKERRIIGGSIVTVTVLLVILLLPLIPAPRAEKTSVFNMMSARFERLFDSPRINQWESLITFTGTVDNETGETFQVSKFYQQPVNLFFGRGQRTNQAVIGAYSHSSLLDVLFETGLLTLTILILLWWVPLIKIQRSSLHFTLKLGIYVNALGLVMMMMTLSAAYQPHWWILWAITMAYAWLDADKVAPDREFEIIKTSRLLSQ